MNLKQFANDKNGFCSDLKMAFRLATALDLQHEETRLKSHQSIDDGRPQVGFDQGARGPLSSHFLGWDLELEIMIVNNG